MAPKLEQVFVLTSFGSKDRLALGPMKGGPHRFIIPLTHGSIEGPELRAEILAGGSDWPLIDMATGVGRMDVRTQAKTAEGDFISIHIVGTVKMDPLIQKALEGSPDAKTSRSEDHYWIATPTFEASSEKLKWLEQNVFIAHGHLVVTDDGTQGVEFEIYKVVSP